MNKETVEKKMDLSECEKLILGCIYEYHRREGEAPNLKDIMQMIEQKYDITWKLQTVCTFFTRMEKKGLITIVKNGRYSYYYPVLAFEVYVGGKIQDLCKAYFGNDIKQLKRFVRQL